MKKNVTKKIILPLSVLCMLLINTMPAFPNNLLPEQPPQIMPLDDEELEDQIINNN